jgi:signal transduction histidine kinase
VFGKALTSIFDRVTGSYIFTLRSFLIFSLIGPIGVAITIPQGEITLTERGKWLAIGFASELILGLYMWAVATFLTPRILKRARPLATIVALAALGGAFRGAAIHLMAPLLGLQDEVHLVLRALNSTITVTIILASIGFIAEGQERYIQEYQDLYRRFLLLKRERQIYITTKPAERLSEVSAYIEKVTATLKGRLAMFGEDEISERDAAAVADEIKEIIEKKIRPLSHKLWMDRSNHVLRFRLSRLIIDALLAKQVPFIPISLFLFGAHFIGVAIPEGLVVAIGTAIPVALTVLAILLIEDVLRDRHIVLGNVLHPLVLIFIGFLPALVAMQMIENLTLTRPNAYLFWMLFVINPFSTVLITILNQMFNDRAKILDLLNKSVTDDLLEEHLHTLAKMNQDSEIATYLHGSLQAELTAIALQLQQAATAGDSVGVRKMVKMAQIVISRDLSEDFTSHENSPLDKLDDFARAWLGIAEISLALSDTDEFSVNFLNDISQLVEEAVSSAVRFGLATVVEVRGQLEGNYYHLMISDNGRRGGVAGRGLGSEILDELAPELWKRKFMDHGALLDIHLPAHHHLVGRSD